MPIQINGATSGSTTIQATDAVTATLTLPGATGTLVSTASPASGNVIQVVSATYNTAGTTVSGTYVTTGLAASITPKFSTSKIFVCISAPVGTSGVTTAFSLFRASTNLAPSGTVQGFAQLYCGGSTVNYTSLALNYLDSPATTSSTTYSLRYYSLGTGYICPNNTTATITLMEIAA